MKKILLAALAWVPCLVFSQIPPLWNLEKIMSVLPPIQRLDARINSEWKEADPVLSPDGQTLFFTREGHPQNIGLEDYSDIWVSYRQSDNTWSRAVHANAPLNDRFPNRLAAVNLSGQTVYTFLFPDSTGWAPPAFSTRQARSWMPSQPVQIGTISEKPQISDFFVSPDERILLLSMEKDDSVGQTDLYVCFSSGAGLWSDPRHLGPVLNTPSAEVEVVLAADGKTLYFSSDGHGGLGGQDLFVSRRLDESWTNWSTPVNLGSPANTPEDDIHFTLSASGNMIYLVQTTQEEQSDLFSYRLPELLRPDPVILWQGNLLPGNSEQLVYGKLVIRTLDAQAPDSLVLSIRPGEPVTRLVPLGSPKIAYVLANGFYSTSLSFPYSGGWLEEPDIDNQHAALIAALRRDPVYLQRDKEIIQLQEALHVMEQKLDSLNKSQVLPPKEMEGERNRFIKETLQRLQPQMTVIQQKYSHHLESYGVNQFSSPTTIRIKSPDSLTWRNTPADSTGKMEIPEKKAEEVKEENVSRSKSIPGPNRAPSSGKDPLPFEDFARWVQMELEREILPDLLKEWGINLFPEVKKEVESTLGEKDRLLLRQKENELFETLQSKPFALPLPPVDPILNGPLLPSWQQNLTGELKALLEPEVKTYLQNTLRPVAMEVLGRNMLHFIQSEHKTALQSELAETFQRQILLEKNLAETFSESEPKAQPEKPLISLPAREWRQDIVLLPVQRGAVLPIHGIFFERNTPDLLPASFAELDRLEQLLLDYPASRIEIGAHTNGNCTHLFAMELTAKRAEAVARHLIERGIAPVRIRWKGYGKTRPLTNDITVEGQLQNQRIEVKILNL